MQIWKDTRKKEYAHWVVLASHLRYGNPSSNMMTMMMMMTKPCIQSCIYSANNGLLKVIRLYRYPRMRLPEKGWRRGAHAMNVLCRWWCLLFPLLVFLGMRLPEKSGRRRFRAHDTVPSLLGCWCFLLLLLLLLRIPVGCGKDKWGNRWRNGRSIGLWRLWPTFVRSLGSPWRILLDWLL